MQTGRKQIHYDKMIWIWMIKLPHYHQLKIKKSTILGNTEGSKNSTYLLCCIHSNTLYHWFQDPIFSLICWVLWSGKKIAMSCHYHQNRKQIAGYMVNNLWTWSYNLFRINCEIPHYIVMFTTDHYLNFEYTNKTCLTR